MAEHSTVATSAVRPNEPARQVIATFDNYADAERAVDYLSDQRFEVNRLAIVGRDLQYVEQVTGPAELRWGSAARRRLGRLVGALIGWIFGLFSLDRTIDLRPGAGRLWPDLRRHRGRPGRTARARAATRSPRLPLRQRTAAQVLRRRRRR